MRQGSDVSRRIWKAITVRSLMKLEKSMTLSQMQPNPVPQTVREAGHLGQSSQPRAVGRER